MAKARPRVATDSGTPQAAEPGTEPSGCGRCWRRSHKKRGCVFGLEPRAPGNRLRGCVAGEGDAKVDFASQGHRLEEAPLCLRFVEGSSHGCSLPPLKLRGARKSWWGMCDPGLPLPPALQGLAGTTTSPPSWGLPEAGETAGRQENAAGLRPRPVSKLKATSCPGR